MDNQNYRPTEHATDWQLYLNADSPIPAESVIPTYTPAERFQKDVEFLASKLELDGSYYHVPRGHVHGTYYRNPRIIAGVMIDELGWVWVSERKVREARKLKLHG